MMWKIARSVLRYLVPALLLIGVGVRAVAAGGEVYTLALLPSAPPVTLHKLWTPVVERLAKETGLEFRLKLYEQMAEFERDIWAGNPDFIFASPIQTVVAHQAAGYRPLVRNAKLVNIGLYVRQDSSIHSVDDLIGKRIAFVGNKNICSVYMQHELSGYGRKLSFEKKYSGSTRNVILNVLLGKSDAGAVFQPALDSEPADTRIQLREVVVTPDFAPHPLSAHPRVPVAAREALAKAMLDLAASKEGALMLKPISLQDLIVADYDRDYRALEAIDIRGLTNWGQ